MSVQEIIIVTILVGASVLFMARRAWAASKGEKGSCKSCGDTCGCAIKDQINSNRQ